VLTTLVALTGGVGAALIGAWAALRARRPLKSRVELVDVSLPPPDPAKDRRDDMPVLDVKVRNTGGQLAVLKRAVVHTDRAARVGGNWMPMPYDTGLPRFVGARLDVSGTYDLTLPDLDDASGARVTIGLSQLVAPAEADRFLIRLGRRHIQPALAYLLRLELVYDADDRTVTTAPMAVPFPQHGAVESAEQIRRDIQSFQEAVNEVRGTIDREMTARGRTRPDWINAPPRDRQELPPGLLSVDGNGISCRPGATASTW
jgi:hypothetical protein